MIFYNYLKKIYRKLLGIRDKSRVWWFKQTNRESLFFGMLFNFFVREYRTQGCKFYIPSDLVKVPFKTRFFFNTYEREERESLPQFLLSNAQVLEIGACIGVVSCITNKLLSNPKAHVVIEANPYLIPVLEKNRTKNNSQFSIENAMISDQNKNLFFLHNLIIGGSGYRETDTPIEVIGISVEEIERKYQITFDTLIMDIEGGEVDFIKKNSSFLKRLKTIFIEIHGFLKDTEYLYCMNTLEMLGFKNVLSRNGCFVWVK